MCFFYGASDFNSRAMVWDLLSLQINSFDAPYFLIGDFNQVELISDKQSNSKRRIRGADSFFKWKLDHQLIDIPFKGPRFTWCNNRDGQA